jgi:hypothetical protein
MFTDNMAYSIELTFIELASLEGVSIFANACPFVCEYL